MFLRTVLKTTPSISAVLLHKSRPTQLSRKNVQFLARSAKKRIPHSQVLHEVHTTETHPTFSHCKKCRFSHFLRTKLQTLCKVCTHTTPAEK